LKAYADEGSTNNYAIYGVVGGEYTPNAGDAGVWGSALGTTGATYGVEGTNASSAGYGAAMLVTHDPKQLCRVGHLVSLPIFSLE
jgi:hypothetical protein